MKQFIYLSLWFFKTKILNRKIPLQTVIFISDECNLTCRHCCVYSKEKPLIKTFEQIKEELQYSYYLGARFVDFEGGEPFLWHEEGKDINDLILLAKQIGFFSTTVTTNAQVPFNHCKADSIWVSLDGIGEYHDKIRGTGAFEKLVQNVSQNNHPALNINMVVNALNYQSVEETIRWVKEQPNLKATAINFHTPYPGTEELFLVWELRKEVINKVLEMKKKGFLIMNSYSGLKKMIKNSFKKYCWVTHFILPDGTRLRECHGQTQGICDRCGFCMAGEIASMFQLKPDTLLAAGALRIKK
jgi:MoaA/NifB/PqqE/SkfB family radical SAM enzyme